MQTRKIKESRVEDHGRGERYLENLEQLIGR